MYRGLRIMFRLEKKYIRCPRGWLLSLSASWGCNWGPPWIPQYDSVMWCAEGFKEALNLRAFQWSVWKCHFWNLISVTSRFRDFCHKLSGGLLKFLYSPPPPLPSLHWKTPHLINLTGLRMAGDCPPARVPGGVEIRRVSIPFIISGRNNLRLVFWARVRVYAYIYIYIYIYMMCLYIYDLMRQRWLNNKADNDNNGIYMYIHMIYVYMYILLGI